jgi:hypothetical protein
MRRTASGTHCFTPNDAPEDHVATNDETVVPVRVPSGEASAEHRLTSCSEFADPEEGPQLPLRENR